MGLQVQLTMDKQWTNENNAFPYRCKSIVGVMIHPVNDGVFRSTCFDSLIATGSLTATTTFKNRPFNLHFWALSVKSNMFAAKNFSSWWTKDYISACATSKVKLYNYQVRWCWIETWLNSSWTFAGPDPWGEYPITPQKLQPGTAGVHVHLWPDPGLKLRVLCGGVSVSVGLWCNDIYCWATKSCVTMQCDLMWLETLV